MTDTAASMVVQPPTALAETAQSAQAAQAQALVLARYAMAERHPRNWIDVRARLLKECERPRFAQTALYDIPRKAWDPESNSYVTKHIIGLSIRFAEAAARLVTNIDIGTSIVFDDDDKIIVSIAVTDLESNTSYTKDVTTEKYTERKRLRKGQKPIRARTNSYGDTIYLVPATEQDVQQKANGNISKAIRDCILRLLPGDIKEECEELIANVVERIDAEDPDKAARGIAAAYAKMGITAEQLSELLGHPLEGTAPAELVTLRAYYETLRDGIANWKSIVECHDGEIPKESEEDPHAELRKQVQERVHKWRTKSPSQPQRQREPGED